MKPSERIKQLHLEYYGNSSVMETASFKALLDYLDEESEKPKYVCPRCYRVVDKEELDCYPPFVCLGLSGFGNTIDRPPRMSGCRYCRGDKNDK